MVSVTNPLMDSEIWGANLAGKCVACRSNKAFTPHPTISAVPLPDATLTRLIRPTSSRTSPPPEVLILSGAECKKPCSLSRVLNLVGDRGFEPPTPSSRTKCATRLRQSPNAGRILLRRCAPVNPLVSKCPLIGEKVVSPLTARRFSVRQGYDTSCCSH